MSKVTKELSKVEVGKVFEVGGYEFIKFPDALGVTPAVAKETVFDSVFGDDNNLKNSTVLKRLTDEFLPKIADSIGQDNLCDITTDLTTLDGLKNYGELVSKVSLPTFDFYRENVKIFDEHKLNKWWWLATPDTAQPHCNPVWIVCVSPRGSIDYDNYCSRCGVRPVLNFVSSILVSCEE